MESTLEGQPTTPEVNLSDRQAVYAETFRLVQARKIAEAQALTDKWLAAHPEEKN